MGGMDGMDGMDGMLAGGSLAVELSRHGSVEDEYGEDSFKDSSYSRSARDSFHEEATPWPTPAAVASAGSVPSSSASLPPAQAPPPPQLIAEPSAESAGSSAVGSSAGARPPSPPPVGAFGGVDEWAGGAPDDLPPELRNLWDDAPPQPLPWLSGPPSATSRAGVGSRTGPDTDSIDGLDGASERGLGEDGADGRVLRLAQVSSADAVKVLPVRTYNCGAR